MDTGRIPGFAGYPDIEAQALAELGRASCNSCSRSRVIRKYQSKVAKRRQEDEQRSRIIPHKGR